MISRIVTKSCIIVGKRVINRGYVAPLKDVNFLIKDVYNIVDHYKSLGYTSETCGEDTIDMILGESAKFCENVLDPLNAVGDTVGYKEAYTQFCEGGWQGISYPEVFGGQGLPNSIALLMSEMSATANFTWSMYPGLSKGAINTIIAHGSEEMKKKYIPRMVSGEFTGTMCLTEPQCGSDLNQVATKAEPLGDGRFKINGTKIFISCGEHDMTNNIIHCVLARLPGAPEGTKGISLFLVPKHKVDEEGNISEAFNGVNIGRIEHKMGCHGSSTCEINFEDAEGYLIGKEHKGMNNMFTFINTSRLGTSMQGVSAAELSFQNALWYTKERRAFRSLNGVVDPKAVADPIIVHPDIRRMLLTQKAVAEGGRSMIYSCVLLADKMDIALAKGDTKLAAEIDDRLGFYTPILKGYLTEMGIEAANLGIQLYGGHGYIKSNKQEQVLRDVRISAIWEGTTGIQALDLLGRKIFRRGANLAPINNHCKDVREFAFSMIMNGENSQIRAHGITLLKKVIDWQIMTYKIGWKAKKNPESVGTASVDYLMYSGHITLAEHWLRMENVAAKKLKAGGDRDFYEAKIQIADFVFKHILPRTTALSEIIGDPSPTVTGLKVNQFSADHAL